MRPRARLLVVLTRLVVLGAPSGVSCVAAASQVLWSTPRDNSHVLGIPVVEGVTQHRKSEWNTNLLEFIGLFCI